MHHIQKLLFIVSVIVLIIATPCKSMVYVRYGSERSETTHFDRDAIKNNNDLYTAFREQQQLDDRYEVRLFHGRSLLQPSETLHYGNVEILHAIVQRIWTFNPTGTLFPKNRTLRIKFNERDNVTDIKNIIKYTLAENKLAKDPFYTIAITHDKKALDDSATLPFKEPLDSYGVVLNKTRLTYSRDLKSKQIIIQLVHVPDQNFSLKALPTQPVDTITIHALQDQNKLKINVDTYGKLKESDGALKKTKFVEINNPQQYLCWQEFSYFFNNEYYVDSTDFTNARTLRLYGLSKQLSALWAEKNGLTFWEGNQQITATPSMPSWKRLVSPQAWTDWLHLQKTRISRTFSTKLGGMIQFARDYFRARRQPKPADISTFAK